MKTTRIALVFPLLALAMGGCTVFDRMGMGGPKHRAGPLTTCNDRVCQVRVSVTEACEITAGDVRIDTREPAVKITWHVSGGEFTPDGITIRRGPPGHFGAPLHQGRTFTYDFRNDPRRREWKFDVKVKVGSSVCVYDPYVMN